MTFYIANRHNLLFVSLLGLSACSSGPLTTEQQMQALSKLQKSAEQDPAHNRENYIYEKDKMTNERLRLANQAKQTGDINTAQKEYQNVLKIDSLNSAASDGLKRLGEADQISSLIELAKKELKHGNAQETLHILQEVLRTAPDNEEAQRLKFQIERDQNRRLINDPSVSDKLNKRVSLEFRATSVMAVLELLAQSSGINFIMDKDLRASDIKTTIYANRTTIQEALQMIMNTSGLKYKILNSNTFLIYSDTPDKRKEYEELLTRSFYLASADVQKTQDLIKALYSPKAMFFDDRLKMLIIRDNRDVLDSIDLLLQAYDLPVPEVVLDVEVLEVSLNKLLNLGINPPTSIGLSVLTPSGAAGRYTINQLRHLTRDNLSLAISDPIAALNFQQTSADTNILASPRIRVKSKEKASIMIGDKVPVITTTTTASAGSVAQSVNYLDVGLKLDVQPEVNRDRQVTIGVKLEVSNITQQITTSTGLVAYQLGTRNASTTLQLQDGETQMLAGLIRNDSQTTANHIPGLGAIPLIGRLFSNTSENKTKTEIVLLITPHIVRPFELPPAYAQEFISGTASQVTTHPLRLSSESDYQAHSDRSTIMAPTIKTAIEPSTTEVSESKLPVDSANPTSTVSDALSSALPTELRDEGPNDVQLTSKDLGSGTQTNSSMQIQFNGPTQVTPGQLFTVALVQRSDAFESMSVDLLHDKSLELVRAVLVAPSNRFEQQAIEHGTRLMFGKTTARQGTIALVTFKVAADAPSSELILSHGTIQSYDGQPPQGFTLDEHNPITVVR